MTPHLCHWPGCTRRVPPRLWGCKSHWLRLPKYLRDDIWRWYREGQEVTKDPSGQYLRAAANAQRWIREHGGAL